MDEIYKQLAERNGWSYSFDGDRPYFMKNGDYAIPDETTSEEDKDLLATIISEGSKEMAQLIKLCWNNGIIISGPCSGIGEFHKKTPTVLHFSFRANKEIINPLYHSLLALLPTLSHMCRESNDLIRYDLVKALNGKALTTEESDKIFSIMKNQLQLELENIAARKR